MKPLTVTLPADIYEWLEQKASEAGSSIEDVVVEQLSKLHPDSPDNPEFLAAMEASISQNRELLRRLAE